MSFSQPALKVRRLFGERSLNCAALATRCKFQFNQLF